MTLRLPRAVSSQAAEDAATRVNRTFGWYSGLPAPGALPTSPGESVVIPHIVAIAEDFARESLLVCSEHHLAPATPMSASLWSTAEKDAERSWESVRDAWKNWHGISFGRFADNERVLGLVDARNAIMHGLGALTRQQKRGDGGAKVRTRITKTGIVMSGDVLLLDATVVSMARAVMLDLIEWLDSEIASRGLWPPAY